MWIAILAVVVGPSIQQPDDCACLCMDGQATTLCRSVEQAQLGAKLCSLAQHCPQEGPVSDADAEPLTPPSAHALNCRAVRIWNPQHENFRTVNVCDVWPPKP